MVCETAPPLTVEEEHFLLRAGVKVNNYHGEK